MPNFPPVLKSILRVSLTLVFGMFVLLSNIVWAADQAPEQSNLLDGWQYRWGDSPRNVDGLFKWASDGNFANGWELTDSPHNLQYRPYKSDGSLEDMLWMRIKLSDVRCEDCSIWFAELTRNYEIYVDGKQIGHFGTIQPGQPVQFEGESANLFDIPHNMKDKWLALRIQSDDRFIGINQNVIVGNRNAIYQSILNASAIPYTIGWGGFFTGLFILLAWLSIRKEQMSFWFSLYTIGIGFMICIREKAIFLMFPDHPMLTLLVLHLYLLNGVIMARYLMTIIGDGPYRILHWFSLLSFGLYLMIFFGNMLGLLQFYVWADMIAPIQAALNFAIIIWVFSTLRQRFELYTWLGLAGFVVLTVAGMIDAYSTIVLHGSVKNVLHYGYLMFIILNVLAISRRIYHHQLVGYKHEQQLEDLISRSTDEMAALQNRLAENDRQTYELNMKLKDANRISQQKDQMLANTTHELRTPLNGIIGITESLLDETAGKINSTLRTNLQMIVLSARRLNNLVSDIVDFSRIKNQTLTLQTKKIRLFDTVQSVVSLFSPMLANKPVYLVNQIDHHFPLIVADENRLIQIFNNLLSNSIKFTLKGAITVRAEIRDNLAVVHVRDSGIGIPANQLTELLKPVPADTNSIAGTSTSSSGFGLAITKQLIEMHQGTFHVESIENEFTEFSFTLPLAEINPSNVPIDQSLDPNFIFLEEPIAPDLQDVTLQDDKIQSQKRILLVDDEPINLQVLQNLLMTYNYELVTARDGFEALGILKEQGQFDLILLDVMMPRLSGYDVCLRVRKSYSANELPILLLTAKNTIDDLVRGFQVGANDYLTKPFAKQELIARVQMQLQLAEHHRMIKNKSNRTTD